MSIMLVIALIGLGIVVVGIEKTVTLTIDTQPVEVTTSVWTLAGLLGEQGIVLNEEDAINIPPSSWLRDGDEITIDKAHWVIIQADGNTQSIFTNQLALQKILASAGIQLSTGDRLIVDGRLGGIETPLSPGGDHRLQIQRAEEFELSIQGQEKTISSDRGTLGEALWAAGIELSAGDKISKPMDTLLIHTSSVEIEKAREITILHAGGEVTSSTTAGSVSEALSEAGIPLQGLDFSIPGANLPIPEDGIIQVIRVKEDVILENDPVPYGSDTQPVADLEIDSRTIVQPGVYGLNTKRVRVRYEDGIEISRQVESEYISQEPQNEIIGYGTKIVPRTLDTPGGRLTYWRALNMYAVSYNVTSNGGYGTATGIPLAKGVAAIDPSYIPYGTRMYIPGYGEALAADTGGGINGRMIDLGYLDENYVSWHQWVTVYFLWPPPENIVWIIP